MTRPNAERALEDAPAAQAVVDRPAFSASAEAYDRFMGRYAAALAPALADAARVSDGQRVLDVGCGPGALTGVLAARVGAGAVAAIDPAPQFAAACQARNLGTDVRVGVAEQLPWADGEFDAALSSLVIGFMTDPDQGIREMRRVTRPGGTVALCMWDIATGGMTMLRLFWTAASQVDPQARGERQLAGGSEGDIARRLAGAGLRDVVDGALYARVEYADFDDFWQPFTDGVGPAGQYLNSLPSEQQTRIRDTCRTMLPDGRFELDARAWYARGSVP